MSESVKRPGRPKKWRDFEPVLTQISYLDRDIFLGVLPVLVNRNLFSGTEVPTYDEVIKKAVLQRGMPFSKGKAADILEMRKVLTAQKIYKMDEVVIRDFGDRAIGFSHDLFAEAIGRDPEKQDHCNVALGRRAHHLVMLLLSECYLQRCDKITISTSAMLTSLGYDRTSLQAYQQLDNLLNTFRYLTFFSWKFRANGKTGHKECGNFIQTIGHTPGSSDYDLRINPDFIGCVYAYISEAGSELSPKAQASCFQWCENIGLITRDYSTAAYMLAQFLVSESGNNALKNVEEPAYKVVAASVERLLDVAAINHSRDSRKAKDLIDALRETLIGFSKHGDLAIVEQLKPSLEDLAKMPPKKLFKETIHLKLLCDVNALQDKVRYLAPRAKRTKAFNLVIESF